jgi:hypothetical protein
MRSIEGGFIKAFITIQGVSDPIQDFRNTHKYINPTPRPVGDKYSPGPREEYA